MSSANVRSAQALQDLKAALHQFRAETKTALDAAVTEIRRMQDWLAERHAHWQTEYRRRQEIVRQAASGLERCEANTYRDPQTGHVYKPDCSRYQQALRQAQAHLREAEVELQNVRYWTQQLQQQVQQVEMQMRRLVGILETDLPKSHALLEGMLWALAGYVTSGIIANSFSGSLSSSAVSNTPPAVSGSWIEKGIQDVPLNHIYLHDSYVRGSEEFKKVPYEVMVSGMQKLESTVRPAVEGGANGDYFSDVDEREGLDYEHGYRRVYDAFYGNEPIRLEKIDGVYHVVGGYHRLFVAQQLGLKTIPANVVEKVA